MKKGREVGPGRTSSVVGKLGKKLQATRNKLSVEGLLQYLVTLPLNFIPVVGNIVFLVINGELFVHLGRTQGKMLISLYVVRFQVRHWLALSLLPIEGS